MQLELKTKYSTAEILNSEGQQISITCEIVMSTLLRLLKGFVDGIPQSVSSPTVNIDKANTRFEFMEISVSNIVKVINPSCTKVFGTHTFYGEGGGG